MPADKDLFAEERHMVTMSFGDHLEELRVRLILALLGLVVGIVITFIPPFLGRLVMIKMEEPASKALKQFYKEDAERRILEAKEAQARTPRSPTTSTRPSSSARSATSRPRPGCQTRRRSRARRSRWTCRPRWRRRSS